MNEFTYHNLFETKGIEYIITIVFFLLLIPFWMLLNRKEKVTSPVTVLKGILSPAFLTVPKGLFYGRNHTWAFLEKSGIAKVGLDDLMAHLTGQVNVFLLKHIGEEVKKGELFAELELDGKILKILSPISGVVKRSNQKLRVEPELYNSDPYGQGWLFEIEPSNWRHETSSYFLAEKATEWLKNEFVRFKDFVAQTLSAQTMDSPQLVMQDGGELVDQTLKNLPKEAWQNFQDEFLQIAE